MRPNQRTPVSCQIQNLIQMLWERVLVCCFIFYQIWRESGTLLEKLRAGLQSAPGELGSGAANRSVNPELICPPYILWMRRVRAMSDLSSSDPRSIVARSATRRHLTHDPSLHDLSRRCPKNHPSSPDFNCTRPIFLNFRTRRRALRTRRRDPSRARPAPVRASPISMHVFSHFPALCQSIPACTC